MLNSSSPFQPKLFIVVLVALIAPRLHAQLRVLSQGDSTSQWLKAQVAQLDVQLADKAVTGDLRAELEAQRKWLGTYTPGKLTKEPLGTKGIDKLMVEPQLDPSGIAKELREKLLGPKAKPTSKETDELKEALKEHPDDLGLRQLQLHWLDQPQYRKSYSSEIADAASRFLGLLSDAKLKKEEQKLAIAFSLYREGRALVYRELPEVLAKSPLDEEGRKKIDEQILGIYTNLVNLIGPGRPEFILLESRMLHHDGWYGRALQLLEENGKSVTAQWYLKNRRDLLRELKWDAPAKEAADIYAQEFPDTVAAE